MVKDIDYDRLEINLTLPEIHIITNLFSNLACFDSAYILAECSNHELDPGGTNEVA